MYQQLQAVVDASGIWRGSRQQSHAFLLSPSVFQISEAQRAELEQLGLALNDCLLGLSHIAVIASDQELNYGGTWLAFRRVFQTSVPQIYLPLQGRNVKHIPRLLKVDLMLDQSGNFKIAEIDGHNKHGLGYSTLGKLFRDAICPDANKLPGTVKLLAADAKRRGFNTVKLLFADQERFYIPEFEVAQQEFAKEGIQLELLPEMYAKVEQLQDGLFVDLPFMNQKPQFYKAILPAYKRGDLQFWIPPKPFLGAKGVMALLRNDQCKPDYEALLRAFIKPNSLELVRRFLPETFVVGHQGLRLPQVQELVKTKRFVLKESVSSGMKGVYFSDEADFADVLTKADKSQANWVLQEEVINQPQTFAWFEQDANGQAELREASDWFMRVTVQFVNHQLADGIVTARRDKAVHGAKDCLQLGTIIV